MVRETRLLTVKPGINRIQFSWANTLIDPTSIDFRILDHIDKVDLLDTTFPAGRNDALQWNIRSGMAGKIPVEIRYFTSGITWKADYVGMANGDETEMGLTGYVRVYNNSGELYDNAQVRLVVGKEMTLPDMGNLGLSPLPDGMVRLFSEYANKDLAYVGGTSTKYVPIGDRVEVNVGRDSDITMIRRLKDQRISNVIARQYKRRLDDKWVLYYDMIDHDETFVYEEEIVSGKPMDVEVEIERRFEANVVLWGSEGKPKDWIFTHSSAILLAVSRVELLAPKHWERSNDQVSEDGVGSYE
ncbi:MAG: hypothetical protein OSB41_08695 [Kiritimatiellae bacterium]|nr:hypothetical protein [Kiritimatiellia bacterium]